jgi:hypothetical protein
MAVGVVAALDQTVEEGGLDCDAAVLDVEIKPALGQRVLQM